MIKREDLLAVPKRKWDEELTGVGCVWIIPSERKHDSEYSCMDFVAEIKASGKLIRFGGGCDDLRLEGSHFRMDCEYPSRILRVWNDRYSFSVSHDLSSISLREER